ncbi:unnamed protein product [Rotaria magnacalcarata]|uniref:Uncharacterized protein n=2 Tax=Rotaria magnacalcarata TaxID=392030 RepID=A0A816WQ09_9BILA|nr:unnamed protein product [Rotaria magnacalcarata]CAF2137011.1 unnamed protein product [Rotaria magnacalcarata]
MRYTKILLIEGEIILVPHYGAYPGSTQLLPVKKKKYVLIFDNQCQLADDDELNVSAVYILVTEIINSSGLILKISNCTEPLHIADGTHLEFSSHQSIHWHEGTTAQDVTLVANVYINCNENYNIYRLHMAEIQLSIIVYGDAEILESTELYCPTPMTIVHDVSTLLRKINKNLQLPDSRVKRYVVLLLESIGKDEDDFYEKIEENSQVLSVFRLWNEDSIPTLNISKLYYITQESIGLALTLSTIQFLRNEAEKQTKLDQIPLAKLYLRKAEKTKDWIMSNLRAEPCHILLIPLNTNASQLTNTIQRLQQYCTKLGYPKTIISPLEDYIPKSEIYHKLPYGKLLFEYEDPRKICRWIRYLSPIRMYLYGNEQIIPSEWSKLMVANEIDHFAELIFNDDDWCTFLENETIKDDIKWNFSAKHGRTWKITQLTPVKLSSLYDNIRFRSSLRRAHITYFSRMSIVSTQIFDWLDGCLESGFIRNEFKLAKHDKASTEIDSKDGEEFDVRLLRSANIEERSFSSTDDDDKNRVKYSLPLSSNQNNELINYCANKLGLTYVWLENEFYPIEQRFQSIIRPNLWEHLSNIDECQLFIQKKLLQRNQKICLVTSNYLAKRLFTYEHVSNIYAAYLYLNEQDMLSHWIQDFPIIRGVHSSLDSLFQQFNCDLTTNIESTPLELPQTVNEDSWPVTFLETDQDGFKRHRYLIEIVLKLPRTLEAKQEMVDELRRVSVENNITFQQINDFEQSYHSNAAIQWYTRDTFLYRLLNRALRCEDVESIIKHRFFIADLYQNLEELHQQILSLSNYSQQPISTYYRGQSMSSSDVDLYRQNVGKLISVNTFFSTTLSLAIALIFAGGSNHESIISNKPVIFSIEVDPLIENKRPYANINCFSAYEGEDEVLFSIGSIFRIEKVDELSDIDHIIVIHLKMADENELPQELATSDFSAYLPEQTILNPVYSCIGLTSLFEASEQCARIKSILEDVDVQFFDTTDDLEHYAKVIKRIQSFIIFIDVKLNIPEASQQRKLLSYAENDTHFNDLIYQLLSEMRNNKRSKEQVKDLLVNIADVYQLPSNSSYYVQLILSSTSKKQSEEEFKSKLSQLSTIITFYQFNSCMYFLESISEPRKIGNATLVLQSDDANIDSLLDQFEKATAVKHMYVCSKHAFDIPYRRIIREKFCNEADLYAQLFSDNLSKSFIQANESIDVYNKKNKANQYFEQVEQFYQLMNEYQCQEKHILE